MPPSQASQRKPHLRHPRRQAAAQLRRLNRALPPPGLDRRQSRARSRPRPQAPHRPSRQRQVPLFRRQGRPPPHRPRPRRRPRRWCHRRRFRHPPRQRRQLPSPSSPARSRHPPPPIDQPRGPQLERPRGVPGLLRQLESLAARVPATIPSADRRGCGRQVDRVRPDRARATIRLAVLRGCVRPGRGPKVASREHPVPTRG